MAYSYYFKNTHYFRKMIHYKYFKNRTTYLNYRRSLKLCMDEDFYYYLEKHKEELDKILSYINTALTHFLKDKGENNLTVTEINQYINQVTEDYRDQAKIENSILEENRLKNLETVDENGKIQRGFHLQAISVQFKELDNLYKNLEELNYKDKIRECAIEIIKRSDISLEDILKQVSTENLQRFYEMMIKAERDVLKNDLKIYIKRNLEQFFPLIASNFTDESIKIDEAHYQYTVLISDNPIQKDYLKFIRSNSLRNQSNVSVDNKTNKELVADVINALKEEEKERVLETSLSIDALIQRYIDYRDSSETVKNRQKLSFIFLKEFLIGNGTEEHPAKQIEELTEEDVKRFGKVFSNATPKNNKKTRNMTLFELANYRIQNGLNRYAENTLDMMQYDIQNFWKYVCKFIKKDLNEKLFDAFNPLYLVQQSNYKENTQESQLRGFTIAELQIFTDIVYSENKINAILMNSPQNFYSFFFGYCLGTRIAEFTYIRTKDIKKQVKNGKIAYYVYLNEDVAPQSLKNKNAHRNLPIPQILIDLGFLNYLNNRIRREKEWLWDYPKSGYGSISVFYQRHIQKNFPTESKELQLRSLRKNFISKVFSKEYSMRELENIKDAISLNQNIKLLAGHAEGTVTGHYLDRIEPVVGKKILDSLGDYELDLVQLKNDVRSFYKTILTDIDNVDDDFNWKKKSNIKPRKGRKV